MKKGQAGLDFLMTYGWALLIIVLVVGALFALGIFNINSFLGSRASGFTEMGVSAWRVNPSGVLTMQLKDQAGTSVNVTSINATIGTNSVYYNTSLNLSVGQTSNTISVGNFSTQQAANTGYTMKVIISYTDLSTGFSYADSGTLTGTVN